MMLSASPTEIYARKKYVTITAQNGTKRRYRCYKQGAFITYGCIMTAVSIAASGFGAKHSPRSIHSGRSSACYSERYALQQLGTGERFRYRAYSLKLASQILTDMGIQNKRVVRFKKSQAIKEIRAHLLQGKPVIVKVKNRRWHGIRLANQHHALVLVGIKKGRVYFINTANGILNGSTHGSKRRHISISLKQLVNHFMYSSKGNTESAYVGSWKSAGGYILVG